jgi:hypothetical protein
LGIDVNIQSLPVLPIAVVAAVVEAAVRPNVPPLASNVIS